MPDFSYATRDDWAQAWQPAIDAIGQDFSSGESVTAVEVIERGAIRRYLEPLELDCPLHYDEAVAKGAGYRGIVAPCSGISMTWTDTGQWRPGWPTNYPNADPNWNSPPTAQGGGGRAMPAPPTQSGIATDIEIEYFEPPIVGDLLTRRGRKLLAVKPRETKVGRGAFMVWETEVVNQRGELVAQLRNGAYLYVINPRGEGPTAASAHAAPRPRGPIMEPFPAPHAEGLTNRTVDWSEQRYFEDVAVGDEIPPVIYTMTVYRLVVEAGANRDFNQFHHNTPVSQMRGAPDMFANNVFVQGMWERTVREYIGLQGRFKQTGPFRMNIFNTVGETVVTRGTVQRKWQEAGQNFVELQIYCQHSKGISVGPGPVIVTLPSRP
ncbi:MAG TPA: MaoC family dehydratase N-terminal domain-containing protein [Dehalococcoidia bacterium]|nr:MaoC family dehydratase N-terminal domain-containing protein [Dehalococcoidia bacterium]